jgi:hypothetical protein
MGISISNQLLGSTGLSVGLGLSRGNGLSFGGFAGGPALYLPFALTGTLDPRITFSRPSLATMYDSTGKLVYAPNNLMLRSNALGTSPWIMSQAGAGLSPVPTNAYSTYEGRNQTRLQFSLNGGTTTGDISFAYQSITYVGTTIHSVFLSSTDGLSTYNMQIVGGDGAATNIVVTGTPTQFFIKAAQTGALNYSIRLRGGQSPANSNTADILAWDSQVEAVTYQTTPGTYNATTSAAYYGPRFDYNPATLVARGLLIEEARTNLALYSQDISNAVWGVFSTGAAKIGVAAATSPDGTLNAYEITTGTSGGPFNGASAVFQSVPVVNAVTYTASLWVRAKTGSATLRFGMQVGSSFDTGDVTVTTDWQRLTISGLTVGSGTGNFSIRSTLAGVSATVYIWGGQFEAGSFATSYIPTVASAVARSADSATMTGTNFSSWYNQTQGTFVVNGLRDNDANGARLINVWNGTLSEKIEINFANSARASGVVSVASVTQAGFLTSNGTAPANQNNKMALAYVIDNFAFSLNAATPLTDTSGLVPVVNEMQIGNQANANYLNGWIASIAYYNTRLPNATLQSLTLPVIADYYFLVTAGGDQLTDASDNPLYTQPLYL